MSSMIMVTATLVVVKTVKCKVSEIEDMRRQPKNPKPSEKNDDLQRRIKALPYESVRYEKTLVSQGT